MIKTFGEWWENKKETPESHSRAALTRFSYEAGVKEASDHYEIEKIKIDQRIVNWGC